MVVSQEYAGADEAIKRAKRPRRVVDIRGYDLQVHDKKSELIYFASITMDGTLVSFAPCGYGNGNRNGNSERPGYDQIPVRPTIEKARAKLFQDAREKGYFNGNNLPGKLEGMPFHLKRDGPIKLIVEYDKAAVEFGGVVENKSKFSLVVDLDLPKFSDEQRKGLERFLKEDKSQEDLAVEIPANF